MGFNAHKLVAELKAIGMQDVSIDEHAYIMATCLQMSRMMFQQ